MANVRPQVNILFPVDNVTDTLTPAIEWEYVDASGHAQKSYRIYIEQIIVSFDSNNEPLLDSNGQIIFTVDAKNFFNFDTGLVESSNTYYLLDQTLETGSYYKLTLQVVNANNIDSLAVQKIFSINSQANVPSLRIKRETLESDVLTPRVEWQFVDPEKLSQTGYELIYKDGDTLVYDSKRVGSVDQFHILPAGVFTDELVGDTGEKIFTLLLTVYSAGNRQASARSLDRKSVV